MPKKSRSKRSETNRKATHRLTAYLGRREWQALRRHCYRNELNYSGTINAALRDHLGLS